MHFFWKQYLSSMRNRISLQKHMAIQLPYTNEIRKKKENRESLTNTSSYTNDKICTFKKEKPDQIYVINYQIHVDIDIHDIFFELSRLYNVEKLVQIIIC
ncbi:hypothetical protein HZS_4682 [Henneguya salminicola]|nr:hypothetical protein HZS_4682 [Henneguya salminicola]